MTKKKIGLILNGPISYSLTFIANEVVLWQEIGYEVVLFVKSNSSTSDNIAIKTYEGLPLKISSPKRISQILGGLVKFFLFGLAPGIRFIKEELAHGSSFQSSIEKAYKLAHIFPVPIDFIHFGFGNVAIQKERLALAMNAQMSVSFRGADIGIFPLNKSDIYSTLWKYTNKIHVISNDLFLEMKRYGLTSSQNVYHINQTLDLTLIKERNNNPSRNSEVRILTVARLHWKKGLEYALSSLKQLQLDGVPFNYTIVGDGEHELAIRYTIKDLGLEDRVTLTGALSNQEVLDLMITSDIYIQSSVQEGFCNAVLEAQACGLLTISTNAEGINENIVDGVTGWIVPKRDVYALSQKIKDVFNLPLEEKEKIRIRAQQRVQEEFYFDRYKNDWKEFFS